MTFKTWINDLRDVQSVINNISNTRVIIDGATGLLNTNSLKEMSSAVSGLSKEQALLVLYTKNLNAAQQEQVLLAAGIISSENSITASAISQALAKTQLSATEKEALLTKLGLIDATTGEAIANATCTKEELLKVLATKGIIGTDADAIISSIGLTSANSAQAISFDLLTASIWANIKALGKWLITNPVGWAIIGGTAIFGLVKAYDALTDSVEEVQERTDKLLDSYNSAISEANSNAKTIESLADRYGELSKGVNNLGENVSLTSDEYSEYKEIVDQIAEMFPTLITGYTDEGTAILSLKGNVEKLRDAYKEAQTEAYNLLIVSGEDSDGNDIISNYKNQVNGNESWLSKQSSYIDGEGGAKDAIDIITKLTGALTPDEFRDTYNELYEQYKNIWNSDKIQEALKSSGFEELSHAPKWGELTSDDLAKVKSTAQATVQTYKAEIDSRLKNVDTLANAYLMTNEDYSKFDEQSQTAASLIVNSITEDIANGFHLKEDVGAYVADIVSKIKDNPDLNKSLIDLFTEDFSSMSVDEAKSKLNGYINTIAKALDEDPVELKVRLGFDDYNDNDIEPLKTKVQGFLKDEFDDKVGELSLDDLQVASKLEIPEGTLLSWDELKQKIEETKNAVSNDTFSIPDADTLEQQISDLNSAIDSIQSAYDTLNSAVEEYNSNGGQLSIDTIQSLLSLSDEYLACLQVENGQLSLNADAMAQLAQAKLDEAQATAVTQAMTELQTIANGEAAQSTTSYISGNAALMSSLAQLSGSYDGVAQAAMTAAQAQELSAQISAASAKDKTATENVMKGLDNKLKLIQATKTTISAGNFAKVAKKSSSSKSGSSSKDELKEQFQAEYDLLKHNLDMEYITEEQYYNGVQALNEKYFAGKEEYLDDYRKYEEEVYKGLKSYYKSYCDDMMDYYDKKLDASKMSYKEYCDSVSKMLADMHNSGKISDKDWYDYTKTMLEKQKDAYDRALSAITRRLQKEIDAWQAKIDALNDQNDALNDQKDQMDSAIDAITKVYDTEIDRIQGIIDGLKEANDERERTLALEQAKYELEKAYSQRVKKIYTEGKGYIYEVDYDAIKDAKKSYDNAELDVKTDELQKQIDTLEEFKKKWQDVQNAYQENIDNMNATALLGSEYQKLVLNNNILDIENFKTKYLKIQSQINDNEQLIKSYEEKVEYYTKLKEQWQSLSDEYSNSVDDMYAKMLLGQSWEADVLNGRLSTLNDFRNQYNDIQKSISDMAWQSANAQISALNAVKAAEATKAQTSGGSNGYSGSSGTTTSVGGNTSGGSGLTAAQKYQVRLAGTVKVIYEGSSETDLRNWITRNNYIGVSRTIQNNIIIYFAKKKEKKYIGQVYKTSGQASSQVGMLGGVGYDKVSGGYQVYKYAKGTDNAKKGWHIVSEDNPELIVRNNGEIDLAKGEQFYKFEGGETVIPADETKKILKNQGNVETLSDSDVITRKDGSILKPLHYEYENILTNFIKDNPDYMYSMNNISDNLCRDLFKNAENVNYDNRSVDNRVSIGEIHLHEVQDVDQFARELDRQLAGIVDQKLSRRKR